MDFGLRGLGWQEVLYFDDAFLVRFHLLKMKISNIEMHFKLRRKEFILIDFKIRVTDMWNSLPDSIVDVPSMNAFKNRLHEAMQEHMFSLKMPSKLRTRL
jgi:hypothetical protein